MLEKVNQYADLIWYVIGGIVAAANGVLGWALWSLRQTFVPRKEFEERFCEVEEDQKKAIEGLNTSIATLTSRVDRMEDALKALPSVKDMQRVVVAMEEMRGAIREQSARMDGLADEQTARLDGLGDVLSGVSRQVEMLFSHHIKER
jgi:uncharacterized coiled-coil protein SlyX